MKYKIIYANGAKLRVKEWLSECKNIEEYKKKKIQDTILNKISELKYAS